MKIILYDNNENKLKIENIKCDEKIDLKKETEYVYTKNISNNDFLRFMNFLFVKIDKTFETEIAYFGENKRIWSYLTLFSYIAGTVRLFYETEEVRNNGILNLSLKNVGFKSKDLKEKLTIEEFEELPEYIRNLYYKNKDEIKLSEMGEKYATNIKG